VCRFEGFRCGRFRSGDNGPGANVGAAPSGRDFLPPPGHGGPVVWNKERNAWGAWWNGGFQTQ